MSDERSTDIRARLTNDFLTTLLEWGADVGGFEKSLIDRMVDNAMGAVDPLLDEIAELDEAVDERDVRLADLDEFVAGVRVTAIPTGYNSPEVHGA